MVNQDKLQKIYRLFLEEASEHMEQMNASLLAFEENPTDTEALDGVLRSAHSVKGTAGATGLSSVEAMVHNLESCVTVFRRDKSQAVGEAFDLLYRLLDAIEAEAIFICTGKRREVEGVPSVADLARVFQVELRPFEMRLYKAADYGSEAQDPEGQLSEAVEQVQAAEKPAQRSSTKAGGRAASKAATAKTASGRAASSKAVTQTPSAALQAPNAAALPSTQGPTRAAETSAAALDPREDGATLRVRTDKIDRLMNCVEDLLQVKAGGVRRDENLQSLETVVASMGRALELVRNTIRESGSVDPARVVHMLDELRRQQDGAARAVEELSFENRKSSHALNGLAERLQDDIRSVRMVPVEQALLTVPRMVRDVSRQLARPVSFVMQGEKTEVDRDLVEVIKDPVLHLLRNAIAHGGETAEQRVARGKDATMNLSLQAVGRAGGLDIVVRDDGAGVNLKRVRERAVELELFTKSDVARMSEDDLLQLIFVPGFSTASSVDSISGRGFGLDIVRERVEACGGSVVLQSHAGKGTEFLLRLPLSLASMRMLLVQVGSRQFAVPIAAVQKVIRVAPDDVKQVDGGLACTVDGRPVPVDRLGNVLGVVQTDVGAPRSPAIVVASGATHVALVVDAIVGEHELIVKNLGDQLQRVHHISGATVLADGTIVPLLNTSDLVRSLSTQRARVELFAEKNASKQRAKRILIADDSITTRTLEKSILEAAGYSVEVATDGVHALEKLGQGKFDLVLSDFQMPRMDGLQLVAAIKADDRYRKIPVVLVSSISGQDDRKRGLSAGADAYLGKQEFSQELLLQTLERLL